MGNETKNETTAVGIKKITLFLNNVLTNDPCAICGNRTDPCWLDFGSAIAWFAMNKQKSMQINNIDLVEINGRLSERIHMHKIKTIKKKTPGRAIRAFCVKCVGGVLGDVKNCGGEGKNPLFDVCPLSPYRMGRGRASVKTIRKLCLVCMGGSPSLIRECSTVYCNCHPYRMGKNPARIGKGHFANRGTNNHAEITVVNGMFEVQDQR